MQSWDNNNLSRSFGAFNKMSRSSFLLCCELNWTQNKTTKSKQPKKLKQEGEKKKVRKLSDFWSLISIPSKSWIMNCFLLIKGENNTAQTCQTTQNSPLEAFSLVAQIYIKLFAENFLLFSRHQTLYDLMTRNLKASASWGVTDAAMTAYWYCTNSWESGRERARDGGWTTAESKYLSKARTAGDLNSRRKLFMSNVLGREREGNDC